MRTLRDRPDVSVVFMRLPDGFPLGTGSAMYDYQSLRRLVDGAISDIEAVDGSQTYSWDDLVETLSELMSDFDPISTPWTTWAASTTATTPTTMPRRS